MYFIIFMTYGQIPTHSSLMIPSGVQQKIHGNGGTYFNWGFIQRWFHEGSIQLCYIQVLFNLPGSWNHLNPDVRNVTETGALN